MSVSLRQKPTLKPRDMEQQTINQLLESIRTMSSMLADLQQQVQQLKEEREDKKDLPPLNPLLEKTEEREESFFVLTAQPEIVKQDKRFKKPTQEQVQAYLDELGETRFSGAEFCDYYEMVGWQVGTKSKMMKDWKSAVRLWRRNSRTPKTNNYGQQTPKQQHPAESADERRDRERQQRLRSLEAAVARKLG